MSRRLDRLPTVVAVLALTAGLVAFLLSLTDERRREARSAPSALSRSSGSPEGAAPSLPGVSASTQNGQIDPFEPSKETQPRVSAKVLARLFEGSTGHSVPTHTTEPPERSVSTRKAGWRFVATAVTAGGRRVYLFAGEVARRVLALTEGEEIDGWTLERIRDESFILSDGSHRYEVQRAITH